MESLESAQLSIMESHPEETPTAVNVNESYQSLMGMEVQETTTFLHLREGDHADSERDSAEGSPEDARRLEEGDRINHKRNDTEGSLTVGVEGDGVPRVGMKFENEYEAYNFYNTYAARVGFSVRKAKVRYSANGVIRQRYYFCSKQGVKVDERICTWRIPNNLEMRTDCKARIRFAVTDGMWEITHFNAEHNHELANPEQRKFLRSYGRVLDTSTSRDIENKEEGNVVIPAIGMKVYSEEEAYSLYNKYAAHMGFCIRRSKCHYNARGLLRQRYYVCSKQGVKEEDKGYGGRKLHSLTARTGCKASIRFKVADGVWEVIYFTTDHNHELAKPGQRKFLRSTRKLTRTNPVTQGLKPRVTGRADNVGFPVPDRHNLVDTPCYSMMEPTDAQSLTNYFKHKQLEDTMFFYTLLVSTNNHVGGFFWRDGRSRIDYDCFGDVVLFDTSFRTHRYNLICAPFVGVNHHGNNVMFGCAILLDDTEATFTWLFETFLESVGNRQPKTIFTNQCRAMADAIAKVFPKTSHRLCFWHVIKDARQRLLSLRENSEFNRLFSKCLNGCHTEEEFQTTWDALVKTFDLADNEGLKKLYDLRAKWCPTFSLDTFSANLWSVDWTKSLYIDNYMSCKPTNLEDFLHQYEKTARRMRLAELEDDLRCNQSLPARASRSSGILIQAADIYTIQIFELFQEEMVESLSIVMKELSSNGALHVYELTEEGHGVRHVLNFDAESCTAACDCKMFESMGILCRHALRVLNMRNVTKIPNQYILKRWTKGARGGVLAQSHDDPSQNTCGDSRSLLRRRLMHKAFCAVDKSLMTARGSIIADALLDQIIEQADRQTSTLNFTEDVDKGDGNSSDYDSIDDMDEVHCSPDMPTVLDHTSAKQKKVGSIRPKRPTVKKRKKTAPISSHFQVQGTQQTVIVPSSSLFQPSQIPTGFHLSFHPLKEGTVSNQYVLPSGLQGHAQPWVFGDANFTPENMLQGQIPRTNQDNSKAHNSSLSARLRPIYPKNHCEHAAGQMPPRARGTEDP